MFGGLMTKQEHNINCINQILGLNIPQITAAVRKAIRKHNIFDGDRPNNADLLYIVFECLTTYLENLNLQHIRANEQRLLKEINQIGQILEIVNVGKYLQYVDYGFRISNVITKKVSNNMVSLTLSGVYLEAEKAFKNQEKHLYAKMLDQIARVTQVTSETPENALSPDQLKFWFDDVIPMVFDNTKDVQNSAIKAVEAALPFIRLSSYQEHPSWPPLETRITNEYSDTVIVLRERGDSLWCKMWNLLVKLLNKKLLKGAFVINKFLAICESGFKSPNYTTRAETFLCWKVLLEIYSQDTKYLSAKRIKLLVIPFKPVAKSPQIAVNKFLVWWSLICKVENQIDQYYDTILIPFLWFCFGLTDKPILSKSVDQGNRQEVYPELMGLSVTALVNLLGPVHDTTIALCKSSPIEEIQASTIIPGLLENVGRFLINSCGEATFLLKRVELVDALQPCDNLWMNMMNRMRDNSDATLTELLLQNLTILANASQNDEPAIRLVTHAATIVLSSKNLIPINASDDVTFGIVKRIAQLLASNTIQFSDNALKKIIDNAFTFSIEPKRLHSQFQQILTLLQKLLSNVRVGVILWYKAVTHILDGVSVNVEQDKEIIYGYIEWATKNAQIDQFLTTWKNLARYLLNRDDAGIFWHRMNEILRSSGDETNTRIYKFIASIFELMKPADPFPSKFKTLIESVIESTPSARVTELQPIIDEINKLSEQITGQHANATFHSLKELVGIVEAKSDLSLHNQFSKFRKNFETFSKSHKLKQKKPTKSKDNEFVFIPSKWQFRPDNLTEHQKEKLKEKRVDIPALYNDMSQSQDSQSVSLKPWTPNKQLPAQFPEPTSRVIESGDVVDDKDSIETIKSTDEAPKNYTQIQASQTETMASTLLDIGTNSTNNNANHPTPSKLDGEERKRKRVQNELNKLQMAIANADQYSNQPRTRRMSVNLTKPEQKLRKRAKTITDNQTTPFKRTRSTASLSVENSGSDCSEVIEASQTLLTTPKTRRTRQKNVSLSKTETPKTDVSVSDAKKSKKEEDNASIDEVNVWLNVSGNTTGSSCASAASTASTVTDVDVEEMSLETLEDVEETEEFVIKPTKEAPELSVNEQEEVRDEQVKNTESATVEVVTATVDESKPKAETLMETSDETAITQENIDHISPIKDEQQPEVVPDAIAELLLVSPVKEHTDDTASKMSIIITSPSANKDCPKTTELLNSTVDISPIPHSKTAKNLDVEVTNPKIHQDATNPQTDSCNENIDKDQIKRTDLDNLIKTPMDSPSMLQIQKPLYNLPANSTPQSHKDPKTRKFQLQGRGAQLLQLMNIRKVEEALLKAKGTSHVIGESTMTPAENIPPSTNNLMSYEDILAMNKDLFRFSKVLPSPQASPSSSIMKRNVQEMTDVDDIESPNQKRKRVSFHDPPVSERKEFIRFAEEVNPNRLRMINRNNTSPLNARNILTRKGRTDSMNEIGKFTVSANETTAIPSEKSMKSLKFDATDDDDDDDEDVIPLLTFSNKDEVLQHVLNEYPMEDVLGKYFESGLTLNDPASKLFANQLTNSMKNDEVKRKLVLEDLSEQFPKEFLDVAFQENLTSTVIERLPSSSILNHITEQAKTDNSVRVQLMEKLLTAFADESTSSGQSEMQENLYELLIKIISHKMNDKQLLDVLDIIFEKRRTNSCS